MGSNASTNGVSIAEWPLIPVQHTTSQPMEAMPCSLLQSQDLLATPNTRNVWPSPLFHVERHAMRCDTTRSGALTLKFVFTPIE